ncbi:hypothetical protein TSUD_250020 [Trifolium subterraneum]|nr:hypothetical protein TSUD_250020 [Trifolium subterraneum]
MEITFPYILSRTGLAKGAVVGITIAGIFGLLLVLVICIYVRYYQKKEEEKTKLPETSTAFSSQDVDKTTNGKIGAKLIVVDKSPEFSYKELANATDNFNLANKIGQGGFGEVYYGELRGKIDVYAFGVVLYELISAKTAVIKIDKTEFECKSLEIKTNESIDEYMSLVALVIDC